jgi:hypothetical protein
MVKREGGTMVKREGEKNNGQKGGGRKTMVKREGEKNNGQKGGGEKQWSKGRGETMVNKILHIH